MKDRKEFRSKRREKREKKGCERRGENDEKLGDQRQIGASSFRPLTFLFSLLYCKYLS